MRAQNDEDRRWVSLTQVIRMHIEELENDKEWESFLEVSPRGTFYHSLKWRKVIQKSFRHHDLYLTIRDKDGTIIGICPGFILGGKRLKVYDSMPYSDYGGPLIARQHIKEASHSLQSFLQGFCSNKGISYARFCFTDVESGRLFRSPLSYVEATQGIMKVDLKATPSDFIWNKVFSRKRRKDMKRVEGRGFQAQEARTKSDLRDFYHLYYMNIKYIGSNPYPYKFMENMWSVLYPRNLRIWLLEKNKKVGGMLLFKDNKKSYCVYVGLDRNQRVDIVDYLVWKEIKKAEEEGHRYVSLGSTPSDPKNRYYVQKLRFGGSFHQQERIWFPTSSSGLILLQTRAKIDRVWNSIRDLLPIGLRHALESKLPRF